MVEGTLTKRKISRDEYQRHLRKLAQCAAEVMAEMLRWPVGETWDSGVTVAEQALDAIAADNDVELPCGECSDDGTGSAHSGCSIRDSR